MSDKLSRPLFDSFLTDLDPNQAPHLDFLYGAYSDLVDGITEMSNQKDNAIRLQNINSLELILYLLGEFTYATRGFDASKIEEFKANEKMAEMLINVTADKYISLSIFNHKERKITNRYLPPISSLELYVNLMLNILSQYQSLFADLQFLSRADSIAFQSVPLFDLLDCTMEILGDCT